MKVWLCLDYENGDFEKFYDEDSAKRHVDKWLRQGIDVMNIDVFTSTTKYQVKVTPEFGYKIDFENTIKAS